MQKKITFLILASFILQSAAFAQSTVSKVRPVQFKNGEEFKLIGFFTFETDQTNSPGYDLIIALDKTRRCPLVEDKDKDGQPVKLDYNAQGLLVKKTTSFNDGTVKRSFYETYSYDTTPEGNVTSITIRNYNVDGKMFESKTTEFGYDTNGNVIRKKDEDGEILATYNEFGKIASWTSKSNTRTTKEVYSYDSSGRLIGIKREGEVPGTKTITYKPYTTDGLDYEDITLFNSDSNEPEQYRVVYDSEGKLVQYHKMKGFSRYVAYDSKGNPSKSFSVKGTYAFLTEYKYNVNGKLQSEVLYQLLTFSNPQTYKIKEISISEVYNFQTGMKTLSGADLSNPGNYKIQMLLTFIFRLSHQPCIFARKPKEKFISLFIGANCHFT